MKSTFRLAAVVAITCAAVHAHATTFTSAADLNAALGSGPRASFNFDGLDPSLHSPLSFSSNGFSFTLSAAQDLFISDTDVGGNQPNDAITLTITAGQVNAIGADFYGAYLGAALPTQIAVTLSDGTTTQFIATPGDSFRGFTTSAFITSLTFNAPLDPKDDLVNSGAYATLDNLVIGQVPEPGSLVLIGAGLAGVLLRRRSA